MFMISFTDGSPPAAAELQPAALQLVCLFNELTFVNLYLYEVLSTVAFKLMHTLAVFSRKHLLW